MIEVLVPFYNPPKGWEKNIVHRIAILQSDLQEDLKLILVNDGTNPGTLKGDLDFITDQYPNTEVIHLSKNLGKGAAIRQGLSHSSADLVLTTDVDFPFDNASMKRVYLKVKEGYAVVLGRRTNSYYRTLPLIRRFISKTFNRLTRIVFGKYPGDTQAGLKGLSAAGKSAYLSTKTNGFLADFEFVRLAAGRKLKMCFVPIALSANITFTTFKGTVMGNELKSFLDILIKKPKDR